MPWENGAAKPRAPALAPNGMVSKTEGLLALLLGVAKGRANFSTDNVARRALLLHDIIPIALEVSGMNVPFGFGARSVITCALVSKTGRAVLPDPSDVAQWRKAERARLLAMRRALPLEAFQAAGAKIMHGLAEVLPPGTHRPVGCYWPFRREPDCIGYMRDVLRAGGEVALPVVIARGQPLEFRPWTERTKMESGAWKILHPAEGPSVTPTALVVPLLGFDDEGFRLGYGAGYYDITLASLLPRPFTVGVGFESARLPSIRPQPHDIGLDVIVTDERKRIFRRE